MMIFICSSKHFYNKILPIKNDLESMGHKVTLPNSFRNPFKEDEMRAKGVTEHATWKSKMFRLQAKKIKVNDAILVVNLEKNGIKNYIGGSTFLEVYEAFTQNKKIFFYNPIPEVNYKDELIAIRPIVINGDLTLIHI